jgi:hypothetical protein
VNNLCELTWGLRSRGREVHKLKGCFRWQVGRKLFEKTSGPDWRGKERKDSRR